MVRYGSEPGGFGSGGTGMTRRVSWVELQPGIMRTGATTIEISNCQIRQMSLLHGIEVGALGIVLFYGVLMVGMMGLI